ncbi:hypothetical protein, partial [Bacillus subtilis]|uniref:hypothetical protein n=1 Tax=Bacillus subtilis TaxID=1423 RepID=UPI003C1F0CCC
IVIRPGRPSDLSFVRATLFESSKDSAVAHSITDAVYARRWRPLVDALVARYRLDVFADDELPDVILGWMLSDNVDTVV